MGREFTDLVRGLQKVPRPVTFGLAPGVDVDVTVEAPPLELDLRRVSGRVTVTGFCKVGANQIGVRVFLRGGCWVFGSDSDSSVAQWEGTFFFFFLRSFVDEDGVW